MAGPRRFAAEQRDGLAQRALGLRGNLIATHVKWVAVISTHFLLEYGSFEAVVWHESSFN
jgi:hypothetical protein